MSSATLRTMADDAELAVLLAAVRSAFHADSPPIECLTSGAIDWERLLRLARFHRIEGLVWRGVGTASAQLPPPVAATLRARAEDIAVTNLVMARQSARLQEAFSAAGINLLFFKGVTLAQLAYGDLGAKAAMDIDVLIDPEATGEATNILGELGYRVAIPKALTDVPTWHSINKESLWLHSSGNAPIDLHTRLADCPALIPHIGGRGRQRMVDFGQGLVLPTLGRDELAAYLAVHGATSAWFRLKWIVDFAALLEREHRGRIEALREAMRALDAQSAGDQALLLADALFDSLEGEPRVRAAVRARWPVRWANSISLAYIRRADEPTERTGGTVGQHAAQLLILDGSIARMREIVRKARALATRRYA